jgi:hypothetical protein
MREGVEETRERGKEMRDNVDIKRHIGDMNVVQDSAKVSNNHPPHRGEPLGARLPTVRHSRSQAHDREGVHELEDVVGGEG